MERRAKAGIETLERQRAAVGLSHAVGDGEAKASAGAAAGGVAAGERTPEVLNPATGNRIPAPAFGPTRSQRRPYIRSTEVVADVKQRTSCLFASAYAKQSPRFSLPIVRKRLPKRMRACLARRATGSSTAARISVQSHS
jgi:hypothetical protein